jgi:hypothetical protein
MPSPSRSFSNQMGHVPEKSTMIMVFVDHQAQIDSEEDICTSEKLTVTSSCAKPPS